jgi:hypothetical protein
LWDTCKLPAASAYCYHANQPIEHVHARTEASRPSQYPVCLYPCRTCRHLLYLWRQLPCVKVTLRVRRWVVDGILNNAGRVMASSKTYRELVATARALAWPPSRGWSSRASPRRHEWMLRREQTEHAHHGSGLCMSRMHRWTCLV